MSPATSSLARLRLWILDNGPALEHDVVGNLVCRGLGPGYRHGAP